MDWNKCTTKAHVISAQSRQTGPEKIQIQDQAVTTMYFPFACAYSTPALPYKLRQKQEVSCSFTEKNPLIQGKQKRDQQHSEGKKSEKNVRNQRYVDVNSRGTLKFDRETQEIMFKHFIKTERYHLIQDFAIAQKILLQLERTKKPALAKSICVYHMIVLEFS